MSGYREYSYDPTAYERQGPPLRPFNWVQWTGVGIVVLGGLLFTAYVLGRFGVIPQFTDDGVPFAAITPIGAMLINSRRETIADPAPELAQARKRWMLIVVALCTAVLSAAVALELAGVAK